MFAATHYEGLLSQVLIALSKLFRAAIAFLKQFVVLLELLVPAQS